MQPLPAGPRTRLALVAVGLLALLAIVALASRSGFGHSSRASPTSIVVSYAFTAFLIVFILMIPIAVYAYILQAREGEVELKSFKSRVIQNLVLLCIFSLIAVVILYIRLHHWHIFHINPKGLKNAANALKHGQAHRSSTRTEPKFEWPLFWVAAVVVSTAVVAAVVQHRRLRARRAALRAAQTESMSEDLVTTIGDAIDDLEAEPDARRAVIAAYARMEGVFGRHGLSRRPSDTPLEYLSRVLMEVTSRGEAVKRLTTLFEQAKFSRRAIDAGRKSEAIGALREIRDDLQGAPA